MCSAEVLVFAEALRRPVGSGPAGVCRRLFAGGDAAESGRLVRDMEEELRRRVTARWNFDFEREVPLPGRYQWVPVGVAQKKTTPLHHEVRPQRKPVAAKGKKSAGAVLLNQHKITDFLQKKKRSAEVPSSHKLKVRRLNDDLAATAAGPT